ncbi:MAG: hypothetical protein ACI9VN_000149 [Patescibacteria group bacterium]|jgi:hypothetical protein
MAFIQVPIVVGTEKRGSSKERLLFLGVQMIVA